jgi:LmbE family N-acetylglucosaminyl deacetylase
MSDDLVRILVIGAHPDDAEFHAGGLAALARGQGFAVRFVSVTNGDAGHHQSWGRPLALRRREEAQAAAAVIGAEVEIWDYRDGHLEPTLDLRWRIVSLVRTYAPDLVLTHRANDYHPDHRAVGQSVQDASYLVTVPSLVPEVPALVRDPVVAYLPDRFTRPNPLRGDVVVDIGKEVDTIVDMLACHASQVYEWLPFNRGLVEAVPADDRARREWLSQWFREIIRPRADRYRQELMATYGAQRGAKIEYIEAFEVSEYGAPLDDQARARLFPFVP